MKVISTLAVIAATTLVTPTFAQDAATERWTGGYGALSYGSYLTEDDFGGTFYGGHAGWNFAVGNSGLIAGLDLKLGTYDSEGTSYSENYASLIAGNAFSEKVFAYGFYGIGDDDGDLTHQAGIGADYALTETFSIGLQAFKGWYPDDGYSWNSISTIVKYSF
jgi:hypothetical protein